jgi:hypothetical protein
VKKSLAPSLPRREIEIKFLHSFREPRVRGFIALLSTPGNIRLRFIAKKSQLESRLRDLIFGLLEYQNR